MTRYSIEVSATAERQLRQLEVADRTRVLKSVLSLRDNARPRGCRKLRGYQDVYRIRAGRFRVLYSVEKFKLVIIVLKIGHRRDVYR